MEPVTAQTDPDLFRYTTDWSRLIRRLVEAGTVSADSAVLRALEAYPRSFFVPTRLAVQAVNDDQALDIGDYQTISRPSVVEKMLRWAQPQPGNCVLDVGTGSGWQAALLSMLVGANGLVVTCERRGNLYQQACRRFAELRLQNVRALLDDAVRSEVHTCDYDIVVSAAACDVVPEVWLQRLKIGGRLVCPLSTSVIRGMTKIDAGGVRNLRYFSRQICSTSVGNFCGIVSSVPSENDSLVGQVLSAPRAFAILGSFLFHEP